MKSLMSAAHAAGYAMAAEEFSEPRTELVRAPHSTAVAVRHASHRGMIATAQRSMRRMWLRAWSSADYFGHHRAAA
jgi:hypothetical protein